MARVDDLRDLRARWSAVEQAETAHLVDQLVRGNPISDGPFGHVEHRVDLRGCPVTQAQRTMVGRRAPAPPPSPPGRASTSRAPTCAS